MNIDHFCINTFRCQLLRCLQTVVDRKSCRNDRYVFSFSKHNAFPKFKLIIRSVIDHRNSQTSEPHIHRPYIFVSRAHRRSCLYVIRRIDHNHSRNRTHQSNIFITLMCRSVFTYGNSGMCCSDFYVQMRITDWISYLLISPSRRKHCEGTCKRNFTRSRQSCCHADHITFRDTAVDETFGICSLK